MRQQNTQVEAWGKGISIPWTSWEALPFSSLVFDCQGRVIVANHMSTDLERQGYPFRVGHIPTWLSDSWNLILLALKDGQFQRYTMAEGCEMHIGPQRLEGELMIFVAIFNFAPKETYNANVDKLPRLAHDINNALGRILGYLEIAADFIVVDKEASSYISKATGALDNAKQLVEEINKIND